MPTISPMQPDQVAEARRVIYSVAHQQFHPHLKLEEALERYATAWPIRDIDEYQASYFENGGAFLVMCDNGRIIGTGALRRLDDKTGEIKRVWLLPEYHGQGLGYQMMRHLLALAQEKGYEKVRLETSPAYQPRALAFYQRLGFYQIPPYEADPNPEDIAMELVLSEDTWSSAGR